MSVMERKLKLENLRIGMVLAQDVVDVDTGERIAEKGRTLDLDTLVRLKTYYVEHLADDDDDGAIFGQGHDDNAILGGSMPHLPKDERHNFINFKNAYIQSFNRTKQYLKSIQEGEPPAIIQLNKVTEDIMATVRFKSDVFAYLNYLNAREDFLYDHSICASLVCRVFADWLKFSQEDTEALATTGLLHDIGMSKIPEEIINKETALSEEDFLKISMHPIYGYNMIKDLDFPPDVKYGVLQHHERIDASGYPNGLKYDQIYRFGKIIGIVDVFTAMINDRPYRGRFAPFDVIKMFERDYLGKLDTEYLMIFLQNIAYNYIDRSVRLSDGRVGTVVFINKAQCSAPIVKLADGSCVDLLFDKTIHILEVL